MPRRLRELERTGAITGARAVVGPAVVGLGFEVLVSVTMDREDAATITEFETALAAVPEIRNAERLFGDPDYLLRVGAADLAGYATLRDQTLPALPGVQRLTSTIVMKRVVEDRPLPLQRAAARSPQRAVPAESAESRRLGGFAAPNSCYAPSRLLPASVLAARFLTLPAAENSGDAARVELEGEAEGVRLAVRGC